MSVSTRTRRATIYPYVAGDDGGYTTSSYGPARGTFFCRVSPVPGAEGTTADQASHVERCVFEFADEVTMHVNDLIVETGVQWKVESFTLRRALRAKVARCYRTDDEPAAPLS